MYKARADNIRPYFSGLIVVGEVVLQEDYLLLVGLMCVYLFQCIVETVCNVNIVHIVACILDTVIYRLSLGLAHKDDLIAGLCCFLSELKVKLVLLCAELYHTRCNEYTAGIEKLQYSKCCTASAWI